MDKKMFDELAQIYEDSGYPTLAKFKARVKKADYVATEKQLKEFLTEQKGFQMFKQRKILRKDYLPIYGKPNTWQMDIAFMPKGYQNSRHKGIITYININTRVAFAVPIKAENEADSIKGMKALLAAHPKVKLMGSDRGVGFTSKNFTEFMEANKIEHHMWKEGKKDTFDHNHLGKIERFNRTFKDMLMKELEMRKTSTWVPLVQKIIDRYNSQEHSAIGMAPEDVSDEDETRFILEAQMKTRRLMSRDKFDVGDRVRIPVAKTLFEKWGIKFSKEIYVIVSKKGLSYQVKRVGQSDSEVLSKRFKYYDLVLAKGTTESSKTKSITEKAKEDGKIRNRTEKARRELASKNKDGNQSKMRSGTRRSQRTKRAPQQKETEHNSDAVLVSELRRKGFGSEFKKNATLADVKKQFNWTRAELVALLE